MNATEARLIIFDTNAVNLLPPSGHRADIIRKLRQSGHHKVAVPWMVMEELVAHQTKHYPDKYRAVVNTLTKLREALPWELKSSLEPLDLNRLVAHWRSAYEEIFEVIGTSGDAARKALAREAMALPPAKATKDRSEGGRDAAVWFSILEYLEENPDAEVCFVTNNTKDFGDGATYPYPMNEDVRGLEGRLTRLTDFDAVVSKFTKLVSGRDAEAATEELLRSLSVRERVSRTAVEVLSSPVGFVGLDTAKASVQWRQWLASPEAELLSIADVLGHEIEGSVWYTANTRWLLHGVAANGDDEDVRYVSCVWEMKVLFSANGGDEAPTLLTPGEPVLPDTDDARCMEIIKKLKARVSRAQRVLRNQLAHSSGERLITESIAGAMPTLDVAGVMARSVSDLVPKLTAADLLGQGFIEQIRASMPTLDIATTLNQAAADRLIAGLPKPDLSGLLPQLDFSHLVPKIDYSHIFPQTTINQIAAAALAGGLQGPADDDDTAVSEVDDSSDPETGPNEAADPETDR
ncbi:PIN domain-containing protein (plasmid) [Streptomyces sp. NBC_01426]|uniref:PIN domain-containing protein n=1 Tax=Streptomyces sp. NBC_01426 TaxID=2975866 RepID=UPI002E353148|nr:PIN domain-containing protein [Streptomyces sp. NBC_01426]